MRKNHNKLYYGKYRHKTIFRLPGSLMFYPTTDEHLLWLQKEYSTAPDMCHLASFIMANRRNVKFRMQDEKTIFYSDFDKSQELIERFWDFWIGSETVDPRFKDLGKDTVGCTRLPHGKYTYQVYLKKDAQVLMTDAQKKNLWQFLERNVDDCLVTNYNIIDFLGNKSPYCFGGYFYVKEEKYLTPIYMLAQQAIDKVIKFKKEKNGSNKKTTR